MFYSLLSFLFYSAPILTLVLRFHHEPNVIAPRYIIEGQPPLPCKNEICPLAKPISTSTNTSVETQTLSASNSTVDKTTLANSTLPRPHQTAPVKCGDTNLPPPCNVTSGSDAANTSKYMELTKVDPPTTNKSKPVVVENPVRFPGTHQTAPVRCGDTGLPPPCN